MSFPLLATLIASNELAVESESGVDLNRIDRRDATARSPAATSANDPMRFRLTSRCFSAQRFPSRRGVVNACRDRTLLSRIISVSSKGAPSSTPDNDAMRLFVRSNRFSAGNAQRPSTAAMALEDRLSSTRCVAHGRMSGSTSILVSAHPFTHSDRRFANRARCVICVSDLTPPP